MSKAKKSASSLLMDKLVSAIVRRNGGIWRYESGGRVILEIEGCRVRLFGSEGVAWLEGTLSKQELQVVIGGLSPPESLD